MRSPSAPRRQPISRFAPPYNVVAGVPFTVTVTAQEANDLTPMGYKGPVTLTVAGNTQKVLGLSSTSLSMNDGTWTGKITLDKADTVTLTASAGLITGVSGTVQVAAGQTAHVTAAVKSPVTAGQPFQVTITTTDANNNPSYNGTISNPAMAVITCNGQTLEPSSFTNVTGTETETVTLYKASIVTLKATLPGVPAATCKVTVVPGIATQFLVTSADSSVVVGVPEVIYVQAQDANGNDTANGTGHVTLGALDGSDVLSSNVADPFRAAAIQLDNNGRGSDSVLLEGVGQVYVTATDATDSSITGTMQKPITVKQAQDWFSTHITDPGMQTRAREDYYYGSKSITYDGMLDLFTQAESEVLSTNTNAALSSLQTLVNNATTVNMPAYVQYLADKILQPDANDVTFLAQYYYNSAASWTVTLTNAAAGGGFVLSVGGQYTGFMPSWASATEILADLQGLPNVGTMVSVTSSAAGVYNVVFTDPYIPNLSGAVLYGGSTLTITSGTDAARMSIPVLMGNDGQPIFGDTSGSYGVGFAAQTTALVNQWFLGTVYPSDAQSAGDNGDANNPAVPPSPYSTPSGNNTSPPVTLSGIDLYGPSGVPLATDVQQGNLGDCWLMAPLAEVAYRDPTMIQSMFTAHDNGTYTVRFYYNGQPEYFTVDNQLPCSGLGMDYPYVGKVYVVLWAALAEKAFTEFSLEIDDYSSSPGYTYQRLDGGDAQGPLAAITGLQSNDVNSPFAATVANDLAQGKFVCLATPSPVNPSPGMFPAHYYAVLNYDHGSRQYLLYNPWGIVGYVAALPAGISKTTLTIQVETDPGGTVKPRPPSATATSSRSTGN